MAKLMFLCTWHMFVKVCALCSLIYVLILNVSGIKWSCFPKRIMHSRNLDKIDFSEKTHWSLWIYQQRRKVWTTLDDPWHATQAQQAGAISYIISHLSVSENPHCVEVGFPYPRGSNTAGLWRLGWNHTQFDSDQKEDPSIRKFSLKATQSTIIKAFREYGIPTSTEYIHIDIDSYDIWVMKAILESEYQPLLLSIEYNALLGRTYGVLADGADVEATGASFLAILHLAKAHGYVLIHVEFGFDMFFLKKDITSGLVIFPDNFWKSNPATFRKLICPEPQFHFKNFSRHIDYKVFENELTRTGNRAHSLEVAHSHFQNHVLPGRMCEVFHQLREGEIEFIPGVGFPIAGPWEQGNYELDLSCMRRVLADVRKSKTCEEYFS